MATLQREAVQTREHKRQENEETQRKIGTPTTSQHEVLAIYLGLSIYHKFMEICRSTERALDFLLIVPTLGWLLQLLFP